MVRSAVRGVVRDVASREYLPLAGTVLIVFVGGVVAARTLDVSRVVEMGRDADPLLLVAAVVVYLCSWPIRARRYDRVLTAMNRRCGFRFLFAAIFVSQSVNLVVPARAGDGVRAYLVKDRRDVPYPIGVASLAIERTVDLLAITVLGGIAIGWLLLTGWSGPRPGTVGVPVIGAIGVAILGLTLTIAAVAIARRDRALSASLRNRVTGRRRSRIVEALLEFLTGVRVVAKSPRTVGTIGLESLGVWAIDVLTAVLVLAALGGGTGSPGWLLLVVGTLAVSLGNLAKVLPLSQGGIGLYEVAFTAVVVGFAPVALGTALAAAILDHAVKNGVTLVGGGIGAIVLNVTPAVVRDRAKATSPDF